MVVIRLARSGAKKRPFYHVVVADQRAAVSGRFIERVGFFNPMARGKEVKLRLDRAKVQAWLDKGAQPSQRVNALIAQWDKSPVELAESAA